MAGAEGRGRAEQYALYPGRPHLRRNGANPAFSVEGMNAQITANRQARQPQPAAQLVPVVQQPKPAAPEQRPVAAHPPAPELKPEPPKPEAPTLKPRVPKRGPKR